MTLPPTFVCAWLSWNLVEQPILSRKASILAAVDRVLEMAAAAIRPYFPRSVSRPTEQSQAVAPGELRVRLRRADRPLSSRAHVQFACLATRQECAYIATTGAAEG